MPSTLRPDSDTLRDLGINYQAGFNAPFGQLAEKPLPKVSTYAITSTSTGDAVYNSLKNLYLTMELLSATAWLYRLKAMLEGAEFGGMPIDEKIAKDIIAQGQALLD